MHGRGHKCGQGHRCGLTVGMGKGLCRQSFTIGVLWLWSGAMVGVTEKDWLACLWHERGVTY